MDKTVEVTHTAEDYKANLLRDLDALRARVVNADRVHCHAFAVILDDAEDQERSTYLQSCAITTEPDTNIEFLRAMQVNVMDHLSEINFQMIGAKNLNEARGDKS